MIQQQTLLHVSDNSGAKTVKCIKVLGGFKRKIARLGDVIIVTVSKLRNKSKKTSKVKKGDIFKALIVKTKTKFAGLDGSTLNFDYNAVSLLTKQEKPLGSRVVGSVPVKLRTGKFSKIAAIASGNI